MGVASRSPRPVPLRQCPGAARPSRPRPTLVFELAYAETPQSQSSSPRGLKTRTLLHRLCPGVGGGGPAKITELQEWGWQLEVSRGWEVSPGPRCGRSPGVSGPCLHRTECWGPTFGCGAEWGGLGGKRPGEQGTESWNPEWLPLPGTTPPFPRPSDFALDLSQSSGTRSGLYWVALGAERRDGVERMFNSLGSNSSHLAPLSLSRSDIQDFHPPGPLPPVVSCPVSPVGSPPPFGSLLQRAAEG